MWEELPRRQQIERRAYDIYEKRGCQSGKDMANWLSAEKELTSHYQRKAAETSALEQQQDCKHTRMLLDFYGLREQPFGITPDPAYLYASRTHGEAFASLSFGIQDNRGFLALIAEPGMGKTTLLYRLLEDLRHSTRTVFVFQTQCDSRELFQYILHELDVDAQGMGLVAMHNKLNELLFAEMIAGKRFVLVVDEAQNLDESVLETVRMLSNFETEHTKLLQIVLAGQPPLAAKLARPQLSQLRQRIAVLSHLEPFTAAETACYIDHRLRVAGYSGEPIFAPDAVGLIAQRAKGIPRNINNTCYNSILIAYARGYGMVTSEIVQEAVARLAIGPLAPNR
jgi:general secretion pathway protein A